MRAAHLAILLTSACAFPVRATGLIRWTGEEVLIAGSNGVSRPIHQTPTSQPLRYADGLLVSLDGTWRKGGIEVGTWHVDEGPTGLSSWVGTVVRSGADGIVLVPREGGPSLGLTGMMVPAMRGEVGELVFVEGLIDGPMRVQVLSWRPLHGPSR